MGSETASFFSLFLLSSCFLFVFLHNLSCTRHQIASVPCKLPIMNNIKTIRKEKENRNITY